MVKRIAALFSDEWCEYKTISKLYEHYIVDYVYEPHVDGETYINNIDGFRSILKRELIRFLNHTGKKHL